MQILPWYQHFSPQAGANMIVSGSAVVSSEDPRSVIALLKNVVMEAIQKRSLDRWLDSNFRGPPHSHRPQAPFTSVFLYPLAECYIHFDIKWLSWWKWGYPEPSDA